MSRDSVVLLSCAVLAALMPAPVAASPRGYRVQLSPTVILAPDVAHSSGTERDIRTGDVVLRAPLGWASAATLEQDVTVEIAGIRDTISAGRILIGVEESSGGDLDGLGPGARIYCAGERVNATNAIASAMTMGLSNLATRVARVSRFCLVDSDVDGSFDRAFLVGAKRDEDRRMVAVEPATYIAMINAPQGLGQSVEVAYGRAPLIGDAIFEIRYIAGGAAQPVQSMRTGEARDAVRTRARTGVRSRQLPQSISFGPAQLTVTRFDPETKDATIRYERDFSLTPVSFTYPPQTIYVYVPG